MKIRKIKIENYRLLKDFSIDLEEELSLVIGKNNTGKTSLLSILDKFLNPSDKRRFTYNDFNLDFKKNLQKTIQEDLPDENSYKVKPLGIYLRLFIEYADTDGLENISNLMMDLDPSNNNIVLGFEYNLPYNELERLKKDYFEFKVKESNKKTENSEYEEKDFDFYLNRNYANYFKSIRKTIEYSLTTSDANELNFKDLEKAKISINNVLSFKFISARREVSNRDVDKTLSTQTSKLYKKSEETTDQQKAIEDFQEKLIDTDFALSNIYSDLFKDVVDKVKEFGGIKANDSVIEILSTLQHRELLEGNTTVMYKQLDSSLPESYNGLGYMNLISMIFEIEYLVREFKRKKDEVPADINLLFIEEPEAHTHPQMQYVFIKNIKNLLKEGIKRDDGKNRKIQYLISTHSSHIVSESDFDDIKYLKKTSVNSVNAKNLKDLEKEYKANDEEKNYRFLKQYLTLNRAELFFADKAILIEGDTERILLPAMIKKFDIAEAIKHKENRTKDNYLPLMSQNISIIEVGAYSQIFEKFIDFIGIKTLILTDIDSFFEQTLYESDGITPQKHNNGNEKKKVVKCPANSPNATHTSNTALHFFFVKKELSFYIDLKFDWKILRKNKHKKWVSNRKGNVLIAYQIHEIGYHARSFEDAFFKINSDFVKEPTNSFSSLTTKYLIKYQNSEIDEFELAENAVNSKPSLAIEILLNSKTDENNVEYANWQTPLYINEGLAWLKND